MENKILLQDLAEALAAHKQIPKREAELFTRAFFEIIEEALHREKTVKVKGLGTFKLTTVSSRESINITTGERFEIEEHEKISFTPDPALRDIINKPFAEFETVVINNEESIKTMEGLNTDIEAEVKVEKENETDDIQPSGTEKNDLQVKSDNIDETNETEENQDRKETSTLGNIDMEEQESCQANNLRKEENKTSESKEEIVIEETDEITTKGAETTTIAEEVLLQEGGSHTNNQLIVVHENATQPVTQGLSWGKAIVLFAVILVLMIGSYLAGVYNLLAPKAIYTQQSPIEQLVAEIPTAPKVNIEIPNELHVDSNSNMMTTIVEEVDKMEEEDVNKKEVEIAPRIEVKEVTPKAKPKTTTYPQLPGGKYEITGTIKTHTVQPGETLSMISRGQYGSREFVDYIIFYNKISQPDLLEKGAVIKLPQLRKRN